MMRKTEKEIACTGYAVAADWYEVDGAGKSLLLLPGYQSKKGRQADFASKVALRGVNVLVIDYSGHGDSPFDLSETRPAQHLLETVCAYDWLRQAVGNKNIVVMGTSYGAFQAAYLSRYRDFQKLVLRTPALYRPEDMYTISTQIDRQEAAEVYRKDAKAVAENPLFAPASVFDGRTLVVVHSEDEDIPITTSDMYCQFFGAEVYTTQGFRHWSRDPLNPPGVLEEQLDAITTWIVAD